MLLVKVIPTKSLRKIKYDSHVVVTFVSSGGKSSVKEIYSKMPNSRRVSSLAMEYDKTHVAVNHSEWCGLVKWWKNELYPFTSNAKQR